MSKESVFRLPGRSGFTRRAFIKGIVATGASVSAISWFATPPRPRARVQGSVERLIALTDPIPLGLYECPTPYHRCLSPRLLSDLGATDRFVYHKDTVCDIDLLREKIDGARSTKLGVYNAHFETGLEGLRHGAAGISPVAGNVFPELFAWLCSHYDAQPERAEEVQRMMTSLAPVVGNKYLVSTKRYLQRNGLPITTYCRSTTARLTAFDEGLIEGLARSVERFKEILELDA